jgi:hypothetical protein
VARLAQLYDPSVMELGALLEGGEFYPAPSFLKPELVATLVRLGLQTSLDRQGIIKVPQNAFRPPYDGQKAFSPYACYSVDVL